MSQIPILEAGKQLREKEQAAIKKVESAIGDAAVGFYGAIGGPDAANHEKAALQAMSQGRIVDSLREAVKVDGAVIEHVAGHDHKPKEIRLGAKNKTTAPER
jgi:hypothetical protein